MLFLLKLLMKYPRLQFDSGVYPEQNDAFL